MPKLKRYAARVNGLDTVLQLTEEQAAKRGLSEVQNTARRSTSSRGSRTPAKPLGPDVDDVAAYKADDVTAYLETADGAERDRVIGLEAARGDKARKTITEWSPAPAE